MASKLQTRGAGGSGPESLRKAAEVAAAAGGPDSSFTRVERRSFQAIALSTADPTAKSCRLPAKDFATHARGGKLPPAGQVRGENFNVS